MQPEQKKKTSPWVYVGCGCGLLVVVGVIAGVALYIFGSRQLEKFEADMANPVVRNEQAKKMLGAQTLPEGYSSEMVLSVPMVIDTAILTTQREDVPANLQQGELRNFLYMHLKPATLNDVEELTAYLEGRSDDASVLERNNIHVQAKEIIGRGVLQLDGRRLLYLTQRGTLQSNQHESQGPGLNAIVLFDCPGQPTIRMGMWTAPDPAPQTPLKQLDTKGTPVDVDAVRAFMSHFNPCLEK
jgi:hypothetical protein